MTSGSELVVVAHVVLPVDDVATLLPLYVDDPDPGAVRVLGRRSLVVSPGATVSLGSYFNAFPAAYWSANARTAGVTVDVRAQGTGSVVLCGSDGEARARVIAEFPVDGSVDLRTAVEFADFVDGGTCWLDLVAGEGELTLLAAEWSVELPTGPRRSASIGMATFNRPADCVAQLRALAGDDELTSLIDRIIVVDQGEDVIAQAPGFADVERSLDDRLVTVRQRNLGGSGGFSRAMEEILVRAESDDVLLLDDDAISEPEAIFRAVRFADAARGPVIVGGGMLHVDDRTVLYTQSEQWNDRIGWVRLDRPGAYDHDFARIPFRNAPFFHRVEASDFNGWWMCLIPASLLREGGLSLPLFLKGDDVEFGRRARALGVPTVSVPGVALWHLGWGGKAPTRSWEAYFVHRNRLIGELLHSPRRRPSGVVVHSFLGDIKPLLTLQYSAVRLRAQAVEDVLGGPESLPGWLGSRAAEIRGLWSGFPDAQPVAETATADRRYAVDAPGGVASAFLLVRTVLRQLATAASPSSRRVPDAFVPSQDLGWWTFASIDSALVPTADGRAIVWYRRSRRMTVRYAWRSVRLHARLWWRWPHLAREFRTAAPRLASRALWREIFAA
ncbi:glycosyltransferase [Microbacterium sp. X-17]|uniref:glycosyltransferase n=1 Tax=Microbacterium sp. X-17 TaxID=3144404 RepID=UPI0031F5CD59